MVYDSLGDYSRGIDYYQQSLTIVREIGDRIGEGCALSNLGMAYDSLGDYNRGIDYYQQSLTIAREIGNRHGKTKTRVWVIDKSNVRSRQDQVATEEPLEIALSLPRKP